MASEMIEQVLPIRERKAIQQGETLQIIYSVGVMAYNEEVSYHAVSFAQ